MPCGITRSLGAVGGVGLIEDASDVVAHCPEADEEFFGDLPVSLARCDQPDDFHLALGQPVGVSRGLGRAGLQLVPEGRLLAS